MPKDERRMPILMKNKEFSTLADLTAENVLHVHNFPPSRLPFQLFRSANIDVEHEKVF